MKTRRQFLEDGWGFGSLALATMLGAESIHAAEGEVASDGKGGVLRTLHHAPKAKRVIQLFMGGAASHLDLFDYKPALVKHHGEKSDFGEHV